MQTSTLEDEKRLALKLAIGFLRAYCRDRFINEIHDCPNQWRDYCLTVNTIVSALNREARLQTLAEDRAMKRKEQNKEANVENIKKRGKRNEKPQASLP
jgi:hypothetical protein